jgi:hypothetical protein
MASTTGIFLNRSSTKSWQGSAADFAFEREETSEQLSKAKYSYLSARSGSELKGKTE